MPGKDQQPPKEFNVVPTVVAHMMTPGVVQVPGDVSVSEAAILLEREHVSCLLVKENETVFGLMTPTDIVKKVVAQGLEPQDIEVRTIMTRPVQFIEYDEALQEASTMMLASGASLLVVTKENQPVGILSAQDLMLSPPRRHTDIPTVLSVVGEDLAHRRAQNATITQLSHVGARIESATELPGKARVVLAFSLPGQNTPLTIHGKVMTCEAPSPDALPQPRKSTVAIEVQFANLWNADLARLKAWALQAIPSSSDHT
jgi:CBS domain-containing protein